ncbi:MAG: GDP-L-fucose synthase [Reichenbachiella sp.]|uniref:GDP-L-fucose synthase family protein n=1 Tax=Reichenbachiella sp. TaxID=2184521 RepID=UPI0032656A4F
MDKNSNIYIAGHSGMVGSACQRLFESRGYSNLILKKRTELDLTNQQAVESFFQKYQPDTVIFAAAKVGGIQANIDHPGDFLYKNLMIQNNVVEASRKNKVQLFINIGSSCVYPRNSPQPMKEEYLLTGTPEPTNEAYAIAKIAGLKLASYYKKQYGFSAINLMPCNLYGPNDSFDLRHSHVLSALVKRFSDAKSEGQHEITLWGTGSARREFMHVDDLAKAILYFANQPFDEDFINVGWGIDISIRELAQKISSLVGFKGSIRWDESKPDGMPRKCLEVSRMKSLGYCPNISLSDGLKQMINIYGSQKNQSLDTQ